MIYNECTTLVWDADSERSYEFVRLRVYGDSVFPAKFSYEPETALKNKAYLNKSRIFKVTLNGHL